MEPSENEFDTPDIENKAAVPFSSKDMEMEMEKERKGKERRRGREGGRKKRREKDMYTIGQK